MGGEGGAGHKASTVCCRAGYSPLKWRDVIEQQSSSSSVKLPFVLRTVFYDHATDPLEPACLLSSSPSLMLLLLLLLMLRPTVGRLKAHCELLYPSAVSPELESREPSEEGWHVTVTLRGTRGMNT